MKNFPACLVTLLFTLSLAGGCSSGPKPNENASGGAITLEDALASIGRGLYVMKTNEQGVNTGLLPDTVTVTLNVGTTKSQANAISGGLTVAAPTPVGATVGANISGSHSNSLTFQTANTITITFKNLLYASATTDASGTNKTATSSGTLPLLKDPATAIQMLDWIATNSFPAITNGRSQTYFTR